MAGFFNYLTISLPNMLDNPYIVQQVELGGNLYFFEYTWNIRHEKVYLSIFTKRDNEDYYFVRNKCLINGNEISKYIYDTEWSGKLLFAQIENLDEADYRVDNFHTDFCINYFADEE